MMSLSPLPGIKKPHFFSAAQTKLSPSYFVRALVQSFKQKVLYEFLMKVKATSVL